MLRFSKRATSAGLAFPLLATVAMTACSGDEAQPGPTGTIDVRLPADNAPFLAIGYVIANDAQSFGGNAHPEDPSMPSFRVDVAAGADYRVTVSALPVSPSNFRCTGSAGPITVVGGSTVTAQVPLACAPIPPSDASTDAPADRAAADRGSTADRATADRSSSDTGARDAATAGDAAGGDGSSVVEEAASDANVPEATPDANVPEAAPDANVPEATPDVAEEATEDGAADEVSDAGQDADDAAADDGGPLD